MEIFKNDCIQFLADNELSWKEAIQLSAKPLLLKGIIKQDYIDSVIEKCEDKGPYMNIGSKIVLAHSRPMSSTKEAAVAILFTKKAIPFMEESKKVELWIFLATPDDKSHIMIIQKLAELLMNAERLEQIFSVKNREGLINILK